MITDRLLALGSPKLLLATVILALLLFLSAAINVWQVGDKARAVGEVEAKLASAKATADSDRNTCVAVNQSANATIAVLGDELHACRGQEQDIANQRDLALRQRARALKAAEGEAFMRREAIEAIARNDENCRRPICRALSDELLNPVSEARNQ